MFHFVAEDFKVIFQILLTNTLTKALECVMGPAPACGENFLEDCEFPSLIEFRIVSLTVFHHSWSFQSLWQS